MTALLGQRSPTIQERMAVVPVAPSPACLLVLAIVPKSEAESWLAQFGNPT